MDWALQWLSSLQESLPSWLITSGGVLAILVPLLGFLAAIHALMSARSTQGKVAWVVGLLSFPWLSLPLYAFVGKNRFYGYVVARRSSSGRGDLKKAMTALQRALSPYRVLKEERFYSEEVLQRKQRLQALEKISGLPVLGGNALELYDDGKEAFEAMIEAIAAAKKTILVEFFIVRADDLGQRFADVLIERAQQGVSVRFLYDEIGSFGLDRKFRNKLIEGGVELYKFGGRRRPFSERFQLNFRNHRKIVLVDDEVAFLGGLNIAIEYLGEHPKLGQWRDTHLQIRGPAVEAVQLVFMEDWLWATGEVLELPCRALPETQNETVLVVPTGPADFFPSGQQFFLQLIEAAKERLWIASPYFVPDEAVLAALQGAALRGVDVRLLLPGVAHQKLVYLSSFSYYPELQRVGVQVWRFYEGFLHQKVFLVDADLAMVGTANLDNRSMFLNFEINALAVGGEFVQRVIAMLEQDFSVSKRVDLEQDWRGRSVFFRLACSCARLFAPVQ